MPKFCGPMSIDSQFEHRNTNEKCFSIVFDRCVQECAYVYLNVEQLERRNENFRGKHGNYTSSRVRESTSVRL